MAGDWIKMRLSLVTHPKVMRAAECLLENRDYLSWSSLHWGVIGYPPNKDRDKQERYDALRITRYVTVCALLRFWGYANEHIKDDETIYGLWPDDVDQISGVPGFASALEAVGWIEDANTGAMKLPNFNKYNVSGANRGATNAERQRRYRERKKGNDSNVTRDVTSNAREEKRRITTPIPPSGAFLRFWGVWPKGERKRSQGKCWELWQRKDYDQVADAVLSHVEVLKASEGWRKGYVPAPLVYLNQRQWEGAEMAPAQERTVAL
jgi:hypothetical protein